MDESVAIVLAVFIVWELMTFFAFTLPNRKEINRQREFIKDAIQLIIDEEGKRTEEDKKTLDTLLKLKNEFNGKLKTSTDMHNLMYEGIIKDLFIKVDVLNEDGKVIAQEDVRIKDIVQIICNRAFTLSCKRNDLASRLEDKE